MPFNPTEPDPTVSSPQQAHLANSFYAELFNQLPVMVVRLTTDGIVLEINTQVTLVTGYAADQLVGRNFWATLFPGKLFAQVPRFISPTAPWGLFRDYPMALRTRNNVEKIIAWTRFLRHVPTPPANPGANPSPPPTGSGRDEIVCLGFDLTNRLTAAESQLVEQLRTGDFGKKCGTPADNSTPSFLDPNFVASLDPELLQVCGIPADHCAPKDGGDCGTIEPLAISPPPPPSGTVTPEALANLQQALDRLAERLHDLQVAVASGQTDRLDLLSSLLPASPSASDPLSIILSLEKCTDPLTLGLIETMQESALSLGKLAGRGKVSETRP